MLRKRVPLLILFTRGRTWQSTAKPLAEGQPEVQLVGPTRLVRRPQWGNGSTYWGTGCAAVTPQSSTHRNPQGLRRDGYARLGHRAVLRSHMPSPYHQTPRKAVSSMLPCHVVACISSYTGRDERGSTEPYGGSRLHLDLPSVMCIGMYC